MKQCQVSVLLICYVASSITALDIFVSSNGTDTPPCIGSSISCLTLGYVLSSLSNATCNATTSSVRIAIGYDHQIFPADFQFQCEIALYIIGVDRVRTLTCGGAKSANARISIHSASSLQWESIQLYGCAGPDVYGLSHVGYATCTIDESWGMIVENTSFVNITQSTFSCAQNIALDQALDSFFTITQADIQIEDSIFIGSNKGVTALWVVSSVLRLGGTVTFANNSGVLGGALRLTASHVVASRNISVLFVDNNAQFGSAVYVENTSCPLVVTDDGFINLVFEQSSAMGSGQSYIYVADPNKLGSTCFPSPLTYYVSYDTKYTFARSSPNNLSVSLASNMAMFPGKDIILDVSVTDFFQNAASCEADISLSYANTSHVSCNDPRHPIELVCPFTTPQQTSSITLLSAKSINTTIQIKTKAAPEVINVTINFSCRTPTSLTSSAVSFELQKCPSYTSFVNSTGKCECLSPLHNEGTFVCSSGIACLAADHWIGQIESSTGTTDFSVILPCFFPYCTSQHAPSCPLTPDVNSFLLGDNPNNQCTSYQGGLLCRGCRDGYCFTHAPSRCVARTSEGAAIGLILLSVFLHLVKAVVIILMLSCEQIDVKLLNSVGSGPIYSALFFLGFIGRLPFDSLSQYRALQYIVSAFRSLILPTLDIISQIPVCIVPSSSSGFLYITGLRYLGAVSLFFILIVYNALLYCCPRFANRLRTSPLKSICLLILWVYYHVVSTSINILKFDSLSEVNEVRVAIQPELLYFRGVHTLLGLIAILLILLFAVPLTMTLLLSQILWRCIDLSRIKPFLDEFQYVYKDHARWFSSAYLILFAAIVAASDKSKDRFVIYSLLLIAFCTLVCFIQPYKVKWLNYVDVALLVCMFTINSLFNQQLLQDQQSTAISAFVYILVILPLVYFAVGLSVAVASRLKCLRHKKLDKNLETQLSNVNEPSHDMVLPPVHVAESAVRNARVANFKDYREPLLSELDTQ